MYMDNNKVIQNNSEEEKEEYVVRKVKGNLGGGEVVGSTLKILGYERDVDSDIYYVTFEFIDAISKEKKKVTIPRKEVSAKKLGEILGEKGGLNISPKRICEHFMAEERKALDIKARQGGIDYNCVDLDGNEVSRKEYVPYVREIHRTVGFLQDENGIKFYGDRILEKGREPYSLYDGKLKIKPTGSIDVYTDMVKEEVIGNVPLETIMAIGASATVLSFSNACWGTNIYNPIVHIYGNLSTGKTTSVLLGVSLGGCPENTSETSLFLTFHSTLAGLMKKLGNNMGYPVAIDELSMLSEKNVTNLIYALAEGAEKERLNRSGISLQNRSRFRTTIFTNGEGSILKYCNKNEGLRYRLFEFDNVTWTKSADSADRIKAVVKKNYGHITPRIAQELLDGGNDWEIQLEQWEERFINDERIKYDPKGKIERVSRVLALFMVSAQILSRVLEMEFHIDDIYDFLFEQIVLSIYEGANIGVRAWEYIYNHFVTNKNDYEEVGFHMPNASMDASTKGIVYTTKSDKTIEGVVYDRVLIYTEDAFNKMIKEGGFEDAKVVLRAIHDNQLLMTKDAKRLYGTFYINDEECKVYKI